MSRTSQILREVYDRLFEAYGPQNWWPADETFEILIGAILVQNTNWKNVEKAIRNLRKAHLLEPHRLYQIPEQELAILIQPAGYFRVKARRLRNLLRFMIEEYQGSLKRMFEERPEVLREKLLQINGIGRETADSILLYAGGHPRFVVDAYTYRVVTRHGWAPPDVDYDSLQALFEDNLELDASLFNEFHALLVQVGKKHCRKNPRCTNCPLEEMLPEKGPYLPE